MSKRIHVIFIAFTIFSFSFANNVRRKRCFFRNAYTKTVIATNMVTVLKPSSCVYLEPSIPVCRGVRNLQQFPDFVKYKTLTIGEEKNGARLLSTTSRYISWGEYFGFVAPTVTRTYRHRETTTVMDPRTVVTFSVKGCRPTRLPLDLDRCAPEIKATPTQSAFPVLHTLPSHGSEQEQSITDYIKGNSQFRHNDVKSQDVFDSLQASYPSYVQDEIVTRPTEHLPYITTEFQ